MPDTFDSVESFLAKVKKGIRYGYPTWCILRTLVFNRDKDDTIKFVERNTSIFSVSYLTRVDVRDSTMCCIKGQLTIGKRHQLRMGMYELIDEYSSTMDDLRAEVNRLTKMVMGVMHPIDANSVEATDAKSIEATDGESKEEDCEFDREYYRLMHC